MLIRTEKALHEWRSIAAAVDGDPADSVCLLVFRWVDRPDTYAGDELVCGLSGPGEVAVFLSRSEALPLALDVGSGDFATSAEGDLVSFGAVPVGAGVWALNPSLNVPGVVHAYVVLTGVPVPAPWECRIIVVGADAVKGGVA